jgi:hypothetical protein
MRASVLLPLSLAAVAVAACDAVLGIQDHPYQADTGTSSGGSGTSGSSYSSSSGGSSGSSSGSSSSGGDTGAADAAQDARVTDGALPVDAGGCLPACSGSTLLCVNGTCVACNPGSASCNGNTPAACNAAGTWVNGTTCGGSTPVCSNGVCGTFIVTGGIRSTGQLPALDAGIYLVAGGFEIETRTCGDAGLCVTGGIVP